MTVTKFVSRVKGRRCPICGAPARQKFRPFCSAHCADADLGAWLGGRYRIPAAADPEGDEAEELAQALGRDEDMDDDGGNDDDGGGDERD